MKLLLLLTTLFLSSISLAHGNDEVLTCRITEPFITYTYNPSYNMLTVTDAVNFGEVNVVSNNAKLVSVTSIDQDGFLGSQYQVVDESTGQVFIEMTFDMQGSDGMSDITFPFSAKIGAWHGGCESTSAPAVNGYRAIDGLKNNQ